MYICMCTCTHYLCRC